MRWSTEAKVGVFALVGILVFSAIVIHLSRLVFWGAPGFHVVGYFREADGVEPGNQVRYAGVVVGMVEGLAVEDGQAVITLRLHEDAEIPSNAKFSIQNVNVMGGRFVKISGGDASRGYLREGMRIQGESGSGIDVTVEKMDQLIASAQAMLDGINAVVTDTQSQQSVKSIISNLDAVSQNLVVLTEQGMGAATQLEGITSQINVLLKELNHDGKVSADTRLILDNLVIASENAKKVSGDAADISGRITGIMSGEDLSVSGELLYNTDTDLLSPDISLKLGKERYGRIGAESVGENTKYNFQYGKSEGNWDIYGGIIRNKPGIGASYGIKRWRFTADVFDPTDLTVRVKGAYEWHPGVFATVQSIFPHHRTGGGEYAGIGFAY